MNVDRRAFLGFGGRRRRGGPDRLLGRRTLPRRGRDLPVQPDRRRMAQAADAGAICDAAPGRHRAACTSPLDHEHRKGTFVCAGCALPLYSSATKFDSGTGWPSFWKPLPNAVRTRATRRFGMDRTEIHCRRCGGHLGHVFDDGPPPTGIALLHERNRPEVRTRMNKLLLAPLIVAAAACSQASAAPPPAAKIDVPAAAGAQTAVFAGGCFWGMEGVFEHVKGVRSVVSGYAGGKAGDANYEQVSSEGTGHAEAVKIAYDPKQVSYGQLLRIFFGRARPDLAQPPGPGPGHQLPLGDLPAKCGAAPRRVGLHRPAQRRPRLSAPDRRPDRKRRLLPGRSLSPGLPAQEPAPPLHHDVGHAEARRPQAPVPGDVAGVGLPFRLAGLDPASTFLLS